MRLFSLSIVFLLFAISQVTAQRSADSVSALATKFNTSGSREFWMGTNYRKEWNIPLKVQVINLATEHGGLTPKKRGGGKQTRSLRLEDSQGREYTLRSIAKFITSKTLPGDLQSEAAADLVSDGVSASYPYAALSIPTLAEAAGIPHGTARIVFIPDDPKLGEFRDEFKNMMALYEERLPDTVQKGYNTEEMEEKLEKDNDNDINELALLRIRILDIFVMDLDRHEGQWTWGAYDNGKGRTFYPIAKDRDQAFYINEGVLPHIVRGKSLVPQLEGFKAKAKDITRFNFSSRNLDRFFLNELSEKDWQQEVDQFIPKMTDEVIDRALAQQPPEIRGISATKIAGTLKERRKYLAAEVMQYYRFLAEIVNVTGSDKRELFDINRNDDGSLLLQVFKLNKNGEASTKMYERKFDPHLTKEVRLYGFDGDDKFLVHGNNDKIKIRMIGGGGSDLFENTSKSNGGLVYDKTDENNKISGKFRNKMSYDTMANNFQRLYYKYPYSAPGISAAYNPDDGVYLGLSYKIIRQGFRKSPYKTLFQIAGNHALSTGAFNFKINSEFIGVLGDHTDLLGQITVKAPRYVTNFFGYGVKSYYDKTKSGKFKYYRAKFNLADASILVRERFSDKVEMTFGPIFEYFNLDDHDNTGKFILQTGSNGLDPNTLFKRQIYLGGKFTLTVDKRNNKVSPQKGFLWENTVRILSGVTDSAYNVTQLNTDFSCYFTLIPNRLVFADRFGGGINMGKFEFYQAQYLGSEEDLRGYRKFRFAGKSKIYNQAELRLRLSTFTTYLFPASFGIFGFVDAGRVFVKNDNDSKMLAGLGGGFWFSPLSRLMLTVSYGVSNEDKIPMVGLGWKF